MSLICAGLAGYIIGWLARDYAMRTAKQDAFFWRRAYLDAIEQFRQEQARAERAAAPADACRCDAVVGGTPHYHTNMIAGLCYCPRSEGPHFPLTHDFIGGL